MFGTVQYNLRYSGVSEEDFHSIEKEKSDDGSVTQQCTGLSKIRLTEGKAKCRL